MKSILLLSLFLVSSITHAKSNLVGVWVNNGKTLSIQIVDDPSEGPFTAGELWSALEGSSKRKVIKTQNLELKCDGFLNGANLPLGSCKLLLNRAHIEDLGSKPDYLFSVVDEEATDVLAQFKQVPKEFLLVYENQKSELRLSANWAKQTFSVFIYNELISP